MVTESEILGMQSRIAELESRLDFLYNRLGITYVQGQDAVDSRIIDMLRKGNKIEAIKIYREIYNCGLAEAKQAVEKMETRY
ncbi:MAG TPA: ribosomal protein L7/L12 [Anaerolineales bacterium]|nr:ribosomal protein L7/L12 [Anaerolineales bacterium]HLO28777.1 ribosomal protein L7/L12 [Anaerolineales bacterium]